MKNNKLVKSACSTVIAFFLSLLLAIVFIIFGINAGFFNKQVVFDQINTSSYYEKNYADFMNRSEEILKGTNLPITLVEDVYTFKLFYIEERDYVNKALEGQDPVHNEEEREQNLESVILDYLEEKQVTLSSELKDGVHEIAIKVNKQYFQNLHLNFLNYLNSQGKQFRKYSVIIIGISGILSTILIVVLLFIYRYKHKGLRYVSYSIMGASAMSCIFGWAILNRVGKFSEVIDGPDFYQDFIRLFTQRSGQIFYYISVFGIFLFIVLVVIIHIMRNKVIGAK